MQVSFYFRQSLPRSIWDWLILIFLLLAALFFLMPIYVMVVTGLKQAQNVSLSTMWQPPTYLSGGGFHEAWKRLYPNMGNSLQLTIPATILSSIFGAINGYIFAKWNFRGANTLFAILVFGLFIPYQSILIPLIQFLEQIKLYGTIGGLILVHVVYGLPICSLIFRNFFANIPDELVEAARLDGAGVVRIFLFVMLPLALPDFVVVAIFQFTNIWNDFLFGSTFAAGDSAPMTVALNNLVNTSTGVVEYNVNMAAAIIAAAPTLLVYAVAGRYFVRGLMAGAIKG